MRTVRNISEEDNFRIENNFVKQDFVKPEPEGTMILVAFKITGYSRDCDGSALANVIQIDKNGEETGWEEGCIGIYPDSELVVTQDELKKMFEGNNEQ